MLDEILEYREYTDKSFLKNGRLLVAPILNDNGKGEGVPRALRIIARHFLFTENNYIEADEDKRKELREEARIRLDEWCFGENTYGLREYVLSSGVKDALKKWQKFEEKKRSIWNSPDIYQYLKWDSPSFYASNYKLIIADALAEGPLRQRFLVIRRNCLENVCYSTDKIEKESVIDAKTGEPNEFGDRVLMLIAAYLLELSRMADGSKLTSLSLADIANWTGYASFSGNKHKMKYLLEFTPGVTEPLFTVIDGKYRIHRRFAELYDPQIMTYEEAIKFRKKCAFESAAIEGGASEELSAIASEGEFSFLILGDDEETFRCKRGKLKIH